MTRLPACVLFPGSASVADRADDLTEGLKIGAGLRLRQRFERRSHPGAHG